jgi:hypothetical protein
MACTLPQPGKVPRFCSLSPVLRCPDRRCGKIVYTNPEAFLGGMVCARCKGHFWATRFEAGSVRQQLLAHFDGEEDVVATIMSLFDLPLMVEQPVYWHVWLTGAEYQAYNRDAATGPWARSRALLRRLLTLHRRAS